MRLILASSSPRRKELLTKLGYTYIVDPSYIDEKIDFNLSPLENVKNIGLKKALATAKNYPSDVILACDTIVVLDDVIYGKPQDKENAFKMLKTLSGKTHLVISGVGIISPKKNYNFAVISEVTFKDLTNEEINSYILTNECFGKAGSYAIQGLGANLIKSYSGELDNIIGLPTKEVKEILEEVL